MIRCAPRQIEKWCRDVPWGWYTFFMLHAAILFLEFSAHAGKLRYPDARPVVIDSPGKICVSSGKNEIGDFIAACPANQDGTCPSTMACATETSTQPREGKIKPGKYEPGVRPSDGPVSEGSRGNKAN